MGNIRVWVNGDKMKKFKEQTLEEEERETMIETSLLEAGLGRDNPVYDGIFQKLKDDFKFLQEHNIKLPYVADFKNPGTHIRLGIYPKDSLDYIYYTRRGEGTPAIL